MRDDDGIEWATNRAAPRVGLKLAAEIFDGERWIGVGQSKDLSTSGIFLRWNRLVDASTVIEVRIIRARRPWFAVRGRFVRQTSEGIAFEFDRGIAAAPDFVVNLDGDAVHELALPLLERLAEAQGIAVTHGHLELVSSGGGHGDESDRVDGEEAANGQLTVTIDRCAPGLR